MEKQHIVTIQLAGISGVLFTILMSLVAFRFFVLPQGRANLSMTEAVPGLASPYIRLEVQPESIPTGEIKVDVLMNTGGQPVVGADLDLDYNPTVIKYEEKNVEASGFFSAIHEEVWEEGRVKFSVFNSAELGDEPVQTNADEEVRVATVTFTVTDSNANLAQIQVLFAPDQLDDTNIILYQAERPEFPEDILQSGEGTIITLRSQP